MTEYPIDISRHVGTLDEFKLRATNAARRGDSEEYNSILRDEETYLKRWQTQLRINLMAVSVGPQTQESNFTEKQRLLMKRLLRETQDISAGIVGAFDRHCRGLCYFGLGDFSHAITELTEQLVHQPQCVESRFFRGISFQRVGNLPSAIRDLRKVLESGGEYLGEVVGAVLDLAHARELSHEEITLIDRFVGASAWQEVEDLFALIHRLSKEVSAAKSGKFGSTAPENLESPHDPLRIVPQFDQWAKSVVEAIERGER